MSDTYTHDQEQSSLAVRERDSGSRSYVVYVTRPGKRGSHRVTIGPVKKFLVGDGLGKPLGILHPNASIQVCDTAVSTAPSQFAWQDLVMLAFEVPIQWHSGASYIMNQRTWALCMTMSDTAGRPLWGQLPGGRPTFTFAGYPVTIVTQMPDVAPGSTPVAFGNWKEAYTVVNRRATTLITDPYSAQFCTLFKFSARIGGAPTCGNAVRLLRIR